MDRLFLQGLVRELTPLLVERRVRSVGLAPEGRGLSLSFSLPPPRTLVFSLMPEAPGLYRGEPPEDFSASPARSKKWLTGAELRGIEMAELDRVVTLFFEQTRLSGRKAPSKLVFEIVSGRGALYLVERERELVAEAFSSSRPRLGAGEPFVALDPPPGAGALADDAYEFTRRLEAAAGREPSRSELMAASGLTPMLVDEMSYLAATEGVGLDRAFEIVRRRLDAPSPVLYLRSGPRVSPGRLCFASPIPLASQHELQSKRMDTFNDAAAEAVRRIDRAHRVGSLRQRLASAVARRSKRLREQKRKLLERRGALAEPSELRRSGERLLAGLGQAKRERGSSVTMPDPFDPEGGRVEIPIDPRLSLAANAERYFRRARKAERTSVEVAKRLAVLEAELEFLANLAMGLDDARELEEVEELEREASEQGLLRSESALASARTPDPRTKPAPRSFRTGRGRTILVGRSGRSNEEVTFRLARPHDLWFHAARMPGAHVVLRVDPGSAAEEDEVEEAAGVAAYFSQGRSDSYVEVMLTERRNVSKIKGAPPGLVRLKDFRSLRVRPALPDEERKS